MNTLEWDLYFLRIAREVSKNSKCLSRKIGSVLVRDKSIISTGYNGPAIGVKHCNERPQSFYSSLETPGQPVIDDRMCYNECPRRHLGYKSGEGLHLCQAGHSERNALIQAAKNGISTLGTTLYCYCGIPCKDCSIEIVNAGIKELICLVKDKNYDNYSEVILNEAGIIIRTVKEELL